MLTGSRASVYEELEWIARAKEFVRRLGNEKRKIMGICFGHQLVAESFDGRVSKNPKGWEVGWASFELSPDAKKELGQTTPVDLYYTHQDAVLTLPTGFKSLGGNEKTAFQGMYKDNSVITFQGHPEFPKEIIYES